MCLVMANLISLVSNNYVKRWKKRVQTPGIGLGRWREQQEEENARNSIVGSGDLSSFKDFQFNVIKRTELFFSEEDSLLSPNANPSEYHCWDSILSSFTWPLLFICAGRSASSVAGTFLAQFALIVSISWVYVVFDFHITIHWNGIFGSKGWLQSRQ